MSARPVTFLTLLLGDLAVGIAGGLRDSLETPMHFAIVAWPKDEPERVTCVGTLPDHRETAASLKVAVEIMTRGRKDN